MENPFKHISQKDLLYIAGAGASLVALFFVFSKGHTVLPSASVPGAVTDTPAVAGSTAGAFSPGYTGYNFGPINPEPLYTASPGDTPAGSGGCCCPSAYGCAGASALDTGAANTELGQFLDYMRDINPNYQKLQETQLQAYSQYFSLGERYGSVSSPVNVPGG